MEDGHSRKAAAANAANSTPTGSQGSRGHGRHDLKKAHADSWPSTGKRPSLPASPKIIKTTEDDVGDVFDYCHTSVTTPSTVELDYGAVSPRFERKRFEFCYPSVSKEDFSNSISIDTHDIDRKKKRIYPSKTPDNSLENESILDGSMASCSSPGHSSTTRAKSPSLSPRHSRRQLNSETINIISNPGYQVLRNSHSTLDRTCSDSVVSLTCRKSTSDLTSEGAMMGSSLGGRPAGRRRSSHKGGGLAFLASRKGSRDSIKSAASNTSVFSNEDIGPLAFQASARGRQRRTSNFLELPVPDHARPRVCSLPERPYNPRQSDDLYRLRHFSISKGTVVNCGDSIISRRSKSNTSVNSTASRASERSPFEGSCCGGGYATVDSLPSSHGEDEDESEPIPTRYRVVMLGDSGVGKTALVSQFMTSEYMHTYDASLDDEFGEKTVSVMLDTEESEMIFIDHPNVEMSVENSLSTYEPHACVVVYSIVDRNSFRVAEEILNYLWSEHYTKEKAVIIAANKSDLARARVITTAEGKHLATSRDAKFIETSSGIQHNVDELLVGVLKQIRLKEQREKRASATNLRNSRTQMSLHIAKEILHKICLTDITKSKSCENLHVL
ncbi:arf-GAP with ANK repeat and PH domain-containing protein cnt-2-like [Anopheles darlingi]|uniref:arf-GAP with ANK repeat and PH domain-containing protein cnt-2-like n=1 Tax=Anopheles darlingi TaxID=43151 RepID=UPI0021001E5B|nr:arf-GAP with ANK repeat and PH domain-containing protein cnt-2-like [Anopheles darlingi]